MLFLFSFLLCTPVQRLCNIIMYNYDEIIFMCVCYIIWPKLYLQHSPTLPHFPHLTFSHTHLPPFPPTSLLTHTYYYIECSHSPTHSSPSVDGWRALLVGSPSVSYSVSLNYLLTISLHDNMTRIVSMMCFSSYKQ